MKRLSEEEAIVVVRQRFPGAVVDHNHEGWCVRAINGEGHLFGFLGCARTGPEAWLQAAWLIQESGTLDECREVIPQEGANMTDEYSTYEFALVVVVRQRGRDQTDAINAALDNLPLHKDALVYTRTPTPHSVAVGPTKVVRQVQVIMGHELNHPPTRAASAPGGTAAT